jgi:hypothetical protein
VAVVPPQATPLPGGWRAPVEPTLYEEGSPAVAAPGKGSSTTFALNTMERGGDPEDIPLPLRQQQAADGSPPAASAAAEKGHGQHGGAGQPPAAWTQCLGRDLAACLASRDWLAREAGLRRLSRETINALASQRQYPERAERLWRLTCEAAARGVTDKVYRVYLASLRCLQSLLVHTPSALASAARSAARPALRGVICKCADSNRRVRETSLEALTEMSRGRQGLFALGLFSADPPDAAGADDLGFDFIFRVVAIEEREARAQRGGGQWQAILGRLAALDQLMSTVSHHFDPANDDGCRRLELAAEFALAHLSSGHASVGRVARAVFVSSAAAFAAADGANGMRRVWAMLASLSDPTLAARMGRKLRSRLATNGCNDPAAVIMLADKAVALAAVQPWNRRRPSQTLHRSYSHSPSLPANEGDTRSASQSPARFKSRTRAATPTAVTSEAERPSQRPRPTYLPLRKTSCPTQPRSSTFSPARGRPSPTGDHFTSGQHCAATVVSSRRPPYHPARRRSASPPPLLSPWSPSLLDASASRGNSSGWHTQWNQVIIRFVSLNYVHT